jgi:hypothetical protein
MFSAWKAVFSDAEIVFSVWKAVFRTWKDRFGA